MRRLGNPFPALLIAALACADGPAAPPTPTGTYRLGTVDAKTLPATLFVQGDYTFQATDGVYTLRPDNSFHSSMTWIERMKGWSHTSTHSFDGTYSIAGDSVTFTWPAEPRSWKGALRGRELTVVHDGQQWVYRK